MSLASRTVSFAEMMVRAQRRHMARLAGQADATQRHRGAAALAGDPVTHPASRAARSGITSARTP